MHPLLLPLLLLTPIQDDIRPVFPVPTEAQIQWHEREMYAFFHYGICTYNDKLVGDGSEDPSLLAPSSVPDPAQWLSVAKAAGLNGGIAVAKHHDGFCLWPTATTTHNVTQSGTPQGKLTNIPRDMARAADSLGIDYGFYLSPWDRNNAHFGTPEYIRQVYIPQLQEILAVAPHPFEFWMDGYNNGWGYYGGAREQRSVNAQTYYDGPTLKTLIHQTSPNCMVALMSEDVRWCGTESGYVGETNWASTTYGVSGYFLSGEKDGWCWNPAECDMTIFQYPGHWFWHSEAKLQSGESLFMHYLMTVGRGGTLLLNLPPDRTGLIPKAMADSLMSMHHLIDQRLTNDLAPLATITASTTADPTPHHTYEPQQLTDGNPLTYWAAPNGQTTAQITLQWDTPQTLYYLTLQEYIRLGQRISSFSVEYSQDGKSWHPCAQSLISSTVGYKRIIPLNGDVTRSYCNPVRAKYLRINILDARACPILHTLSVF